MNKQQLAKDFINYALLFAAFIFLGVVAVVISGSLGTNLLKSVPYLLAPHDSGLSDHIRYAETVGAIFGLLVYTIYLIYCVAKMQSRTALIWIAAALVEIALLFFSLIDRSLGHAPYAASDYAVTWLQLIVAAPLILGYSYFVFKNASSPTGAKKRA